MENLIDYLINQESKKTVGMVLKRIEIFSDQAQKEGKDHLTFKELELVKSSIKEVIYEQFRNFRDFLLTGKYCMEFKTKK